MTRRAYTYKASNKSYCICWSAVVVFGRKRPIGGSFFVSLPVGSLNDLLKKSYMEARRKNKEPYNKLSLTAICFGLCHHIKSSRPDVDIINSEFEEAKSFQG